MNLARHLRSRFTIHMQIALCVFPLLFPSAIHAQNDHIENLFRQGAQAMHTGHPAEAEKYFREATPLAPRMPEAHLDLALTLWRQGKLDEATQSIQTALQLNPNLPGA